MAAPSPAKERERLEQQLLDELQAAERTYHSATAEHTKVRNEHGNMLDGVNDSYALHEAAEHERVARENYTRALKAFNDLVVHGRRPDSPAV